MRRLAFAVLVFFPLLAAAQQRPIFDPDDFVDPRTYDGSVFASRLVAGGVANYIDDYRPSHQATGFVHWTNSFYWSNFQIDYKRTETRGEPTPPVQTCPCQPPVFFPTPPSSESTPTAPPPGGKDTLQFGGYVRAQHIMLRMRLTVARQHIDTIATLLNSSAVATRLSGHEQSVGFDGDTYLPIGRGIFGELHYSQTSRKGTAADRKQREFAYTNRFPGYALRSVILRSTLAIGTVTDRGGTAINVVNPAFEAFWHDPKTRVNFHLVYSPQATRSGTGGWESHHQIALFADWGKVWLFKRPSR